MSEELCGRRADEVQGQPFMNLELGLPLDSLERPIREAADGELEQETSVVDAVNRRGKPVRSRTPVPLGRAQRRGVMLLMEPESEE